MTREPLPSMPVVVTSILPKSRLHLPQPTAPSNPPPSTLSKTPPTYLQEHPANISPHPPTYKNTPPTSSPPSPLSKTPPTYLQEHPANPSPAASPHRPIPFTIPSPLHAGSPQGTKSTGHRDRSHLHRLPQLSGLPESTTAGKVRLWCRHMAPSSRRQRAWLDVQMGRYSPCPMNDQ